MEATPLMRVCFLNWVEPISHRSPQIWFIHEFIIITVSCAHGTTPTLWSALLVVCGSKLLVTILITRATDHSH
jgi:hypothetical protein